MLHTFLLPPFADPVKQAQFEALQTTLAAEPDAPLSLLLGNFAVAEGGDVFDAVLVRPHSVSVLLFVAGGGLLTVPAQGAGPWQLDGQPVRGGSSTGNPFGQFRRLQEPLADWLASQLGADQVPAELLTGFALFAEPVTFGPGVEQFLRTQPGADSFQLLKDLDQLPLRLRQAAHPEIQLSDTELTAWAKDLADEHPADAQPANELPYEAADEPADGFWAQKAQQLWRWLGAEDVPHDAPYGSAAAMAASSEEKRQLEQIRQQMRRELAQQRQEMEAREAEREKSIAQLRAQLAQAPAAAPDATALHARLATETREKAALEEAIRASRAEAAARNQELDARIQQLGQLIEQVQAKPPVPVGRGEVSRPTAAKPAHQNLLKRPTAQLRWPRVALVAGAAVGIGLGAWGLAQLVKNKEETSSQPTAVNRTEPTETTDNEPSLDALTDTITREIGAVSDSNTTETLPSEAVPTATHETTSADDPAPHDTIYQAPEDPVEPDETDSTSSENN